MAETKEEMQKRLEAAVAELQAENEKLIADGDALNDKYQALVEKGNAQGELLGSHAGSVSSSWLKVEGSEDRCGVLEVMSVGRSDRAGAVLRYVASDGQVLMCHVDSSVFVDAGSTSGYARLRVQG